MEEWLERIGRLFHLDAERRKLWDPAHARDAQSAEFDAIQRELEACLERLFDTALTEGEQLIVVRDRLEQDRRLDGACGIGPCGRSGAGPGVAARARTGAAAVRIGSKMFTVNDLQDSEKNLKKGVDRQFRMCHGT